MPKPEPIRAVRRALLSRRKTDLKKHPFALRSLITYTYGCFTLGPPICPTALDCAGSRDDARLMRQAVAWQEKAEAWPSEAGWAAPRRVMAASRLDARRPNWPFNLQPWSASISPMAQIPMAG